MLVVFADSTVPTHVPDGSLVLGTMLLAASSIGLGSCWINRAKEAFETKEGKALKAAWGIEETYVGIGNCILGYVKGELPAPGAAQSRLYRHGLTLPTSHRRYIMSYRTSGILRRHRARR